MADEKTLSPSQLQALAAEIRADEQAARVRDFGQADAATYEQRVTEGAASVQHLAPEPPAVSPAEVERSVTMIEQTFEQILDQAAARMDTRSEEKGLER